MVAVWVPDGLHLSDLLARIDPPDRSDLPGVRNPTPKTQEGEACGGLPLLRFRTLPVASRPGPTVVGCGGSPPATW